MRGQDIILAIIGVVFLYIAHLLQTSRLRLAWEGFQNSRRTIGSVGRRQAMPKLNDEALMKLALHVKTLCSNSQDIDSIINGIREIQAKDPSSSAAFMPGSVAPPMPTASPMPAAPPMPANHVYFPH
jgi:hypothetical protein